MGPGGLRSGGDTTSYRRRPRPDVGRCCCDHPPPFRSPQRPGHFRDHAVDSRSSDSSDRARAERSGRFVRRPVPRQFRRSVLLLPSARHGGPAPGHRHTPVRRLGTSSAGLLVGRLDHLERAGRPPPGRAGRRLPARARGASGGGQRRHGRLRRHARAGAGRGRAGARGAVVAPGCRGSPDVECQRTHGRRARSADTAQDAGADPSHSGSALPGRGAAYVEDVRTGGFEGRVVVARDLLQLDMET